jgi:flagellar hook-associated protein 2
MAAVSSLGIGSGLDLNTLLSGLKAAEQAPLVALQTQQTSYTTKLTAYGQLSSALSNLQTAAAALAKPELYKGVTASSTSSDVVTSTAKSTAQSGTYSLDVKQLSQAQSLVANGVASTTAAIGGGRVTIEFGTISTSPPDAGTGKYTLATPDPVTGKYTSATFTADAARTKSIDIDPAKSSLTDIAAAINAKADLGVTASIVNDGSSTPNRLVLTSKQTGETSSMKITVTANPDWTPAATTANSAGLATLQGLMNNNPAATQNLQQTAAAQNTKLTVNGIAITSATNSVVDAVKDVTMTVAKVGTSTLSVKKDTDSAGNAVATFVNAFNNLQTIAAKLTAFDATSKSGAVLLGDSTLRNIQTGIRSALTTAQGDSAGSGLTMLSQIGVSFQKDGKLALDSTKLTAALEGKLTGVADLFSGGASAYGTKMASLIASYTDTTGGVLAAATKGINTTLDMLGKQYTATSARVEATVARYKAQFTQLDVMMSQMNQTSTYLTAQFEAMNNTNNK